MIEFELGEEWKRKERENEYELRRMSETELPRLHILLDDFARDFGSSLLMISNELLKNLD